MAKTVTTVWDPAEHLETEADMAAYLEAALEDSDPPSPRRRSAISLEPKE